MMLIMSRINNANSQEMIGKDTIYVNDFSFEEIGKYSSSDSIFTDLKNKKVHLYSCLLYTSDAADE